MSLQANFTCDEEPSTAGLHHVTKKSVTGTGAFYGSSRDKRIIRMPKWLQN